MNRKQKKIKILILIKVIKRVKKMQNIIDWILKVIPNLLFHIIKILITQIENFNISEKNSKNDNKAIPQDSFEIISITNSLKSKKRKINSSSYSKNGNLISYVESSQNANSVDDSLEFQTF